MAKDGLRTKKSESLKTKQNSILKFEMTDTAAVQNDSSIGILSVGFCAPD
jgi:hypothetical protein